MMRIGEKERRKKTVGRGRRKKTLGKRRKKKKP